MKKQISLLDNINSPADLRKLNRNDLTQLADELREDVINFVSVTGGHFGAGLGVVELTVALHYVFNTPKDKLVWDVSHQTYPHKILTGRRSRMHSIRQKDGLCGFTSRSESEYDAFGAGHSSTSISAALGMAVARDINGDDGHVIAVIGDGAMSAGLAYEAMNNAGALNNRLIVILNDNQMSISPAVGALNNYLSRLISSRPFLTLRDIAKLVVSKISRRLCKAAGKADEYARGMLVGGTLFEELGFYYIGPVDGNRLDHLVPLLENIKNAETIGPILLHIVTEKGKGHPFPEQNEEKYHAVTKFNRNTGKQLKSKANAPTYTNVFANSLIKEALKDDKIIAITAAMASGTGLNKFREQFSDRFFDVGIAEQHAVTFAAGLATQGLKPFVAIYSTFLQRAYDQIVHDVALQSLPVRFAIDRAGLVGSDGPTHAGCYDITYLCCLPNFIVMAAADESELVNMIATAASINDKPCAIRYPRGEGIGVDLPDVGVPLPIGKGRIIKKGKKVALFSLGTRLNECLKAADMLEASGLTTTVADARFAKPLDVALLTCLVTEHKVLVTIEEGAIGGFGSHVLQYLTDNNLLSSDVKVITMGLPDDNIDHATAEEQYQIAKLQATNIVDKIFSVLGVTSDNFLVEPI